MGDSAELQCKKTDEKVLYEPKKTSSGSEMIDSFLHGGYENDVITTLYGPAGSGKTNLCILAAISTVKNKKRVIYMDTEGISVERIKQLCPENYEEVLQKIVFFRPTSFKEQQEAFKKLKDIINDRIGLVVIDTISMLYRLELGKSEEVYETNRELGKQISYLTEIARKKNIPILIANQVYSNFEEKDKINMVGGDILKYGSKCLLELQIVPDSTRRLVLKKHRALPEEKEIEFKICQSGIEPVKKSFSIFKI